MCLQLWRMQEVFAEYVRQFLPVEAPVGQAVVVGQTDGMFAPDCYAMA